MATIDKEHNLRQKLDGYNRQRAQPKGKNWMATIDKEHNLRAKTGWLQSTKNTT
jgi:hypothetical protein